MDESLLLRYSRSILLNEVDISGQNLLGCHRVLIVGLGGLGVPVLSYLSASGVGTLGLLDYDTLDLSNLQRQVIYKTSDVGRPKLGLASDFINSLNPNIQVNQHNLQIDKSTLDSLADIIKQYDLIIDTTDKFETRNLINAVALQVRKPLFSAAAIGFQGQLYAFAGYDKKYACYNCIYNNIDDTRNCSNSGILPPITGFIGCLLASYILKYITTGEDFLFRNMLNFDIQNNKFKTSCFYKDTRCKTCS